MKIYNLFPPLAGKFADWTPHLDRAAKMGFDWIFVNPIHKPGGSGSLYSVADYFELNARFVDPQSSKSPEAQMKEVIRRAERRGLQLMVDLVINHCASDSPLLSKHPEWFLRNEDGSIAHPFCIENGHKTVWGDLARFDHRNNADPNGLYRYCFKIVDYLMRLGFKGFRCDAAYQVPGKLWRRLIGETKNQHPDVFFLAETLGCTADETKKTADAGFDYVFNSSKWWDFSKPWLLEQYDLIRERAPSISFPESHDTERLMEEMHGNVDALKQRYLFAGVFSSGVMMPIGFEFGFRKRLHVVNTRPENWEETDLDLTDFIAHVNTLKTRFRIFQEECPTQVLRHDNPAVLLMWKASVKTPEEALIILNKDPWNRQHFHAESLGAFMQGGAPLMDVSPDDPMDFVPVPFSYELRPGEGRVLVTTRE
jgi:starch synthase (maltosyl-transferring)